MKFQKLELCERFCFVRGNTSIGGSCINRELQNLDMYHSGWQTLSLDKVLSPAERVFRFRSIILCLLFEMFSGLLIT